jgi:glutamate 5-kinase
MKGRKKWMAFSPQAEGTVVVDAGARRAIVSGHRSLLPAGVRAVKGHFAMGSVVSIQDEQGQEIARGLCNFASEELDRIRGMNTRKIPEVLGSDTYFEEVVHRDNLVVVVQE